jgi:hypothetical protein
MFHSIIRIWKTIGVLLVAFGLYWLPKDIQDSGQAAEPWQRAWALVDQNTLLWVALVVMGGWVIYSDLRPLWREWRGPKYPTRHAAILQQIADCIAEAEQVATVRLNALMTLSTEARLDHYQAFHAAQLKVHRLTTQIAYDGPTVTTVNDYLHLCGMILDDELNRQPSAGERRELDQIRGSIFERLHAGKSLNRDAIPLPQWMRDTGSKTLR